jgi:AraC-like DNA-binding protein
VLRSAATSAPTGDSYVERAPVPALAGLVSSVWVQQIPGGAPPYVQRNLPHGGGELVCALGSLPRLRGPATGPVVEVLAPGTTVVGMRLRPGVVGSLLGARAAVLVDLAVPADAVWGRAAVGLGDRMASACCPAEALAVLQEHVTGLQRDAAEVDPLVQEVVRRLMPWRAGDVGSLAPQLSISERQLRRRCLAAVGLGAKTLQRTLRFQGFLGLAQRGLAQGRAPAQDGLAALAGAAGYADQAHLNRECLRLTGLTPRAFLAQAQERCACGHDHSAAFEPLLGPGRATA